MSRAIAIVGMGCRFAGARDLQAYWRTSVEGLDGFGPPPPDRWLHEAFFDPDPRAKDKSYTPTGGFIQDIQSFPAVALGIPPRRVEVMDPQQRLALEISLQAVEDGGLRPADLPRRTGVYLGVTAVEYKTINLARVTAQLMASGALGEAPQDVSAIERAVSRVVPPRPFTAPGLLANMIAATVAQELRLQGPAFTSDAACASAHVAVADAVAGLRSGDIEAALAGGVYVCITPEHHIAFSRIGAISRQGRCLPFDHRADGFVQGDGCGVLLLQRLEDAERAGRRIYAVIEGASLNNDGGGEGPMAPVQRGQIDVIERAWADSGLDPATLGYVEAHGTGTAVGDEVEFGGLVSALGAGDGPVALGSSKANVGHTMSAAGVAGVIRTALAIHHQTIPPMAGFESARETVDLESTRFDVPIEARPWTSPQRVAGVSSFGFGGTNGHIVLRQASANGAMRSVEQAELLLMSAGSEEQLRDLAARTADAVEADSTVTVAGVSRAWAARPKQPARLGVVAATREELIERLRELGSGTAMDPGGRVPPGTALIGTAEGTPSVAFLYPGQGAQRTGMLAGIRDRFAVVGETLEQLSAVTEPTLLELLYPEVDDPAATERLTATQNCQPALLAVGVALTRLLEQVGVRPAEVAGHSVGEFTAAVTAGVLSERDGVKWAATRGAAMAALNGDRGAMVALRAGRAAAEALLVDGAVIANVNHGRQTVVSGGTRAVHEVASRAEAAGVRSAVLTVSHGFHSPVLSALDLADAVAALDLRDPAVPLISCVDEGAWTDAEHARSVFARHATSPVDWVRTMAHVQSDLLLQVGAGGPLQGFARGTGKPAMTLANTDDGDGGRSLLGALARLWVAGVDVDVLPITAEAPIASVPPTVYPRRSYWAVKDTVTSHVSLSTAHSTAGTAAASSDATTAPASAEAGGVAATVMAAVARASAYPLDSLRLDMRLSDDLGFDSMMLAELTAELSKVIPGMDGIPQEVLVDSPTIARIIEAAERGGSVPAIEHDDDAPLSRFRPVWRAAPLPSGTRERGSAPIVHVGERDSVALGAVLAGEAVAIDPAGRLIAELDRAAGLGHRPDVIVLCQDDDPFAESLAGAVRAAAREWPDAVCKCVRVEGAIDVSLADAELGSADTSVDVRYTASGTRQVLGLEPLGPAQPSWTPDGEAVLVTGGSRGIGAAVADALEAAGATVFRLGRAQADVTDALSLEAWVSALETPITTLVHAAGLLADGPLGSVSAAKGAVARAVKGHGLINAVRACGPSLKTVLALGSHAGRFGNRHQAHYAAGNALMSSLCVHMPPRIRAVCAELGPWVSSEMVSSIPAGIQSAMRSQGVDFVGDAAGIAALLEELGGGAGVVVRGRRLPWTTRRLAMDRPMSPASDPWLNDHAIDGRPVLPLARAAGLLAEAAGVRAPFTLEDLVLFQGVPVPEPVTLQLRASGDRIELRKDDTLCYRATVRPFGDGEAIRREGGDPPSLSLGDFYEKHTFHGPSLQGIESIDALGPDFVVGRVRVGDTRPIDLLALDSAMQLTAYVAFTRYGRAGTPIGIARWVQLRGWPEGTLTAQAVFGEAEGDRFEAALAFWDADGELVAVAEGVAARMPKIEATAPAIEVDPIWSDPERWPEVMALQARMQEVAELGLENPYFDLHEGTARDTTRIDGRDVINFSSYNYLGLSGDARIREDVARAMERYGTSVSASRVASGERPFHRELEALLAQAHGGDDAIVFPSGHATNVTVIGHLLGEKDLVLHDELIHDSCLQGIKLSGAARRGFRHDDPDDLARQLGRLRGHYERCLVLIEGVYSMDGDVAALPEIVDLKERYGCLMMVDEAHSFGTIGATGRGIGEHYGIDPQRVDLWMGTMSKSLASMGGWIASGAALTEYLRYTTPGFVFAAGVTPTVGQAALSALKLMREEPWRVERLQHNSRFFYERLRETGLDTGDAVGASPVVPVITGHSGQALMLAQSLLEQGINAKPIIYPAVAEDAVRLRFFVTALHTEEQLAHTAVCVAETLALVRRKLT